MRILPVVLLVACGQTRGFGGQDLGGDKLSSDDASVPSEADNAADLPEVDAQTCDTPTTWPDPLESTIELAGGVGLIDVVHRDIAGQCCAEWHFEAIATGTAIDVTYFDASDEECDCDCLWTLEYTVDGLAAGDWTVSADGVQDRVTVD